MLNLCTICLKGELNLRSINEIDESNVQIIVKLLRCVPEVEWKVEHQICHACLMHLDSFCAFRDLCIKSFASLKQEVSIVEQKFELKFEEPVSGSDDDIRDGVNHDDDDTVPTEDFACFHCHKSYKVKKKLESHIKRQHNKHSSKNNNSRHSCDECGKTYLSESCLEKHKLVCQTSTITKIRSDPKIHNICDICGSSFSNKYLLKRHIRNVHATEKRFVCELCDRRFASPVYLNAHKRYHSGERKHICSFCGKGYITASDLYHHEKIHANKRAYRCQLCPKAFNTSSDLHKHKICVHLDRSQWKYECTFCQRRFPLKTNLDTHTKSHTGERNFLCHLCDRKCINRSVLKRHIESHSVVKSFKCSLCLQAYKYQRSLDIHMVKMHGIGDAKIPEKIKKFICPMCPKSYFANNKLQKHIRSHTGERPFPCPACDKCFIDKSYIKQHLKTAHNMS